MGVGGRWESAFGSVRKLIKCCHLRPPIISNGFGNKTTEEKKNIIFVQLK